MAHIVPGRSGARSIAALVALAFVLVSVSAAPAGAFHQHAIPIVHSEAVAGDASVGVRAETTGGAFEVSIITAEPRRSSVASAAIIITDAAGNFVAGATAILPVSNDRLIVTPAGPADGSGLPDGFEIEFLSEPSPDSPDGFITGAAATWRNGEPGVYHMVLWAAGGTDGVFELRAEEGVTLTWNVGAAHSLGTAEITNGAPNVQVQERLPFGLKVGAKVIRDASVDVSTTSRVYGFWGTTDVKGGCVLLAGLCVVKQDADFAANIVCGLVVGEACAGSRISWDGPGGGGSGATSYSIFNREPGDYRFRIDAMLDAYGPRVFNSAAGLYVVADESYAYLSAADVAVPS